MSEVQDVSGSSLTTAQQQQQMQNMQQQLMSQQQQLNTIKQQLAHNQQLPEQLQPQQPQQPTVPAYTNPAAGIAPVSYAAGYNATIPSSPAAYNAGYVNNSAVIITPAYTEPRHSPVAGALNAHALRGCGGSLITGGILAGTFATTAIIYYAHYASTGAGYWCGLAFIVAGAVATHAGRYRQRPAIIASVITSAASAVFAVVLFAISLAGLLYDIDDWNRWYYCNRYYYYSMYCYYYVVTVSNGLLAALGALAFFVSLAAFVHSIRGVCCLQQVQPASDATGYQQQQQTMNHVDYDLGIETISA